MPHSISLTSTEFLDKLKTKEYDFIPYDQSFNLPARLLSDEISEDDVIEITSYVDGIKMTYYLPINIGKYLSLNHYNIDYEKRTITFIEKFSYTNNQKSFLFELKDTIKLYYLVSAEEWKNAILMAYKMVINHNNKKDLYFTYENVYKNICGRNNDMGYNIMNGVNKLLKDNGKKKKISLGGCDIGSHVSISKTD